MDSGGAQAVLAKSSRLVLLSRNLLRLLTRRLAATEGPGQHVGVSTRNQRGRAATTTRQARFR